VLAASAQDEDAQEDDLCPIRFQGQWEDAETGLHYNRFRYYDPLTASYLSLDPIGLGGGTRPGSYVRKPLTMIDPYGLEEGSKPPFYTFPNNAGGNISVSTMPIDQSHFGNIVDNAKGPVNVLTGTHGDELGNFGGRYAEPVFFNEDFARWGQNPNVKVLDVTKMSPEEIQRMVNSPDNTVCAWCYSEKAKFVGKIEKPPE
jgi:RHS repeat-associated protein